MELFKPYIVAVLVLILFTVDTGGTLIIPLLLKLVALKGALFIGTPIALGSFLVGQGIGFFAGNIAGGYAVLKAAQKYHTKEKAKWKSPVKHHFKGHGWGWQGPKYTKGYTKGYNVGNVLAQLINHHKHQSSYHDYYDDGGGYPDNSYGFTAGGTHGYGAPSQVSTSYGYPAPSHGYGAPAPSPAYGYGGYASPSYYAPDYAPPKESSFMDKLMSKLPSFLGGKSNDEGQVTYGQTGPYGFADASYPTDYDPSGDPQNPMPTYSMYHGTPNLPGQTFSPPNTGGDKYAFSPYKQQNQGGQSEALFEDSEYTYSSSPYAKPQPKRPAHAHQGYGKDEIYPGGAEAYDGPAKEYTGVMTDYFSAIQSMKQKPYGKPMGNPMGPGEYTDSYSSASSKEEQILNLASSLHKYAAGQRRKDVGITDTDSKAKISPSYVVQKFLEKKLEEKVKKAEDAEQRKEAKELISTLRKAYLQQLAESLKSDGEGEDGEQEVSEEADDQSEVPVSPTPVNSEVTPPPSEVSSIVTEPTKFLPWIPRYKREDLKASDTARTNPLLDLNAEQLEQVKLLYSFMEEIKQFFTLVSALDEDTCLQKMVCDVHAQSVSGVKSPQVTTYESNMISTFRIIDAIVPFDPAAPQDSTTKYRLAAKIGTVGASTDVCLQYYSTCGYTSDQIISLGNQVAEATTEASASESTNEEPTPAPSSSSPVFGTRIRTQRSDDVEEVTMPKV